MTQHRVYVMALAGLLILQFFASVAVADEGIEFFESRIRPVLVESCYECHNTAETAEADLALDWKDGIRAKTEHGTVVVPGKPEKSLLLKVIRHEIPDLEMPEAGPKLNETVASDFEKWIKMGAPDPRAAPPSEEELAEATSWEKTLEKRKEWWSFQPVQDVTPPDHASPHPIDRFVRAKLADEKLAPASKADRRTLIRRLSFALTGLPPTTDDVDAFVNDASNNAFEKLVDRYLDSTHFGERWARHWMDLIRYTDSHGSEGDPQIPHAYQYRDYLIRALNADVRYDQLVREHLAGDLLETPRLNEELGINESAIGPAHFRFVFHGFAPTDALDEKVRFTDDQINVVSKAFMGLTVSCARCHDHKFDAISQSDYYAMFGIFASCRPALRDVNLPDRKAKNAERIRAEKDELRGLLAKQWLQSVDQLAEQLLEPDDDLSKKIEATKSESELLHIWKKLTTDDADSKFEEAWKQLYEKWAGQRNFSAEADIRRKWNLSDDSDYQSWFAFGNGMPGPAAAGEFAVSNEGPIVSGVFPAGAVTHGVSETHRAFLGSPRFKLDDEYDAWFLVAGNGQPSLRYVVENYPRNGTVYPIKTVNKKSFKWEKFSLKYWQGDNIHFEIATSKDAPLQNRNQDRSWFALRDVVLTKSGSPGPPDVGLEYLSPIFEISEKSPKSKGELAGRIQVALTSAIRSWRDGNANDQQALLLNAALAVLPNSLEQFSDASSLQSKVKSIRKLESEIPLPTRVPGVVEADAFDQPLFVRGDHRKPAEPVKRRFLEAIDNNAYETELSGRRELAESILHADNPLTGRVIANRIWHYLFGRGIVATPDNFGQLGTKPSHPELLDYLAKRMRQNEWSIKDAIRFVVTSETWQASSSPSAEALEKDPENRLLSHMNVNRLDAESIRDNLLLVSGQLASDMYGRGFPANSKQKRRSVYVTSRRNSLDSFLKTFDSPTPFATTGRRDATNVPAQSLTLMNDPFVIQLAKEWAAETASGSPRDRVAHMIQAAFGREPDDAEIKTLLRYVEGMDSEFATRIEQRQKLDEEVKAARLALAAIEDPVRERLLKDQSDSDAESTSLSPLAAWEFDGDLKDSLGKLHGKAHGTAKIEGDALILDGDGYVATGPLPQDLKAKTLEAWVQLETLDQAGGGAITIQTQDGVVFDSMVFAERRPKRWMAGSNGFVRTDDFDGPDESDAVSKVTHVAVVYEEDGTIRFYRNGTPYGKAIRKADLQHYTAKKSQVLFGLRHGKVGSDDDGRKLKAKLFAAKIYDRALSQEEVMASSSGGNYVSDKMLMEALSAEQRSEVAKLRTQLAAQEQQQAALPKPPERDEAWARLAHAIFNLKEFIYLK